MRRWDISGSLNRATVTFVCPDMNGLYEQLQAIRSSITSNLVELVQEARQVAPGTRMLDILYPYVLDSSNPCANDYTAHGLARWYGEKSLINALDDAHLAMNDQVAGVVHVDLRPSRHGFGLNPVSFLQQKRVFGYPHPETNGQDQIASAAVAMLH